MQCKTEGLCFFFSIAPFLLVLYSIHTWVISHMHSLCNKRMLPGDSLSLPFIFSLSILSPHSHPRMSLPPQMFPRALMTSQNKSSTTPEVKFRADYLKQSMHVISTSRPSQTNSILSFFFFLPLCYSLIGMAFMAGAQQLFPSPCFSLNMSPLLALVPKQRGSCRGWNLASLHTEARRKQ